MRQSDCAIYKFPDCLITYGRLKNMLLTEVISAISPQNAYFSNPIELYEQITCFYCNEIEFIIKRLGSIKFQLSKPKQHKMYKYIS